MLAHAVIYDDAVNGGRFRHVVRGAHDCDHAVIMFRAAFPHDGIHVVSSDAIDVPAPFDGWGRPA